MILGKVLGWNRGLNTVLHGRKMIRIVESRKRKVTGFTLGHRWQLHAPPESGHSMAG